MGGRSLRWQNHLSSLTTTGSCLWPSIEARVCCNTLNARRLVRIKSCLSISVINHVPSSSSASDEWNRFSKSHHHFDLLCIWVSQFSGSLFNALLSFAIKFALCSITNRIHYSSELPGEQFRKQKKYRRRRNETLTFLILSSNIKSTTCLNNLSGDYKSTGWRNLLCVDLSVHQMISNQKRGL